MLVEMRAEELVDEQFFGISFDMHEKTSQCRSFYALSDIGRPPISFFSQS